MAGNVPTPQDIDAESRRDDAALASETLAQKNATERLDRESKINTTEEAERKRRAKANLSSLFTSAAAYFMFHDVPKLGKIGKGPDCVIDHGTHIYIPRNPTPAHLQQVADLARRKGWGSITLFHENGRTLHEKTSAAMQQAAPDLNVCTDRRGAGSLHQCRLGVIRQHNAMKAAAREEAMSQLVQPQPA